MKKTLLIFGLLVFCISKANAAQKLTYLEEMYNLGSVSGQGLACKSQKYHQFELLARAILVGKVIPPAR